METPPFSELGLRAELLKAVQAMTIPPALEGSDLVGISETGSGKTAAFGLPILQKIDTSLKATQALVLCPTRELAVQVCEEIHRLGKKTPRPFYRSDLALLMIAKSGTSKQVLTSLSGHRGD